MAEVSAKSFLGLLQKSGLCDKAELKASISELFKKVGGSSVKLDQLTEHLLENGLVSEWHLKKLMSGKYKGFFLGKYKLIRHLGTGGMSTVYLAEHTIFNQQRAVKVLPRDRIADKTFLQRFYREGRAAAALNHRNIVRVYDIDHEGDTHFLVMEYVKGEDIYEKVKRGGPLPCDKAIDYMIQTMTGLQHAHDNDLVHRDIKPANLLVTPDGDLKVLDLGLALFQEDDGSLTVMHNERVLGTADYLSPEQAVDSHNIDYRADIYSAGCTLYFMLTGKPPFPEGTIAQRIAKHQTKEPESIKNFRDDCPATLLDVVHKMMQKKPEKRFSSCDALAAVLRQIGDALIIGTPAIKTGIEKSTDVASVNVDTTASATPATRGGRHGAKKSAPTKKSAATVDRRDVNSKPNREAIATDRVTEKNRVQGKQPGSQARNRGSAAKAASSAGVPVKRPAENARRKPKVSQPVDSVDPQREGVSRKSEPENRPRSSQANTQRKSPDMAAAIKPADVSGSGAAKPKTGASKGRKSKKSLPVEGNRSAIMDITRKPIVDESELTMVLPRESDESEAVDVRELRSFVAQNRTPRKASAKPKRNSGKDQLILAGFVIGMLLLLGLVLWIAISFVNDKPDVDSSQEAYARPTVQQLTGPVPVSLADNPCHANCNRSFNASQYYVLKS